jgi:hypothetical protein
MTPTENGWQDYGGSLQPLWFEGPALPSYLFKEGEMMDINNNDFVDELDIRDALYDSDDTIVLDGQDIDIELSDSDDEAWSEDSEADNE